MSQPDRGRPATPTDRGTTDAKPKGSRLGRYARLAGVAIATALAGCTTGDSPTESDGPGTDTPGSSTTGPGTRSPSTPSPSERPTTSTAEPPTPTPPPTTRPPATTGPPPTTAPPTTSSCTDAEYDELLEELNDLNSDLADLRYAIDNQAEKALALKYMKRQLEGAIDGEIRETARSVGETARESVVYLEVDTGHGVAAGTGWFIDEGHVLTNAHVVQSGETVYDTATGHTLDGTTFDATLANHVSDGQPDMALFETDFSGVPTLPVGSSADLAEGEVLVQVGHNASFGNWTVTAGYFVAHYPFVGQGYTDLRSTVNGLQGSSGSPVLDLDGNVVGMNWGGESATNRDPGVEPIAAPDTVVDAPIAPITIAQHLGSDSLLEVYEGWTT